MTKTMKITKPLLEVITTIIFLSTLSQAMGNGWDNPPPGPTRTPIVGNLFQLAPQQQDTYVKWAKEFGPIIRVDLAGTKTVVISDHKLVAEMFEKTSYQGRLSFALFDFANDGKVYGVLNTEGRDWEEMRHFAIKHIHELGKSYGRNTTEDILLQDIQQFVTSLEQNEGMSLGDMKTRFWTSIGSSLWTILTGATYQHDDPKLIELTTKSMTFKAGIEKGGVFLVAPIIAKILPGVSGFSQVRQTVDSFGEAIKPTIGEHKKKCCAKSDNGDVTFTDKFLQMSKTAKEDSPFYGKPGENHLHGLLGDLYFAGSDTLSSTMSFMTLYLSKTYNVLKKLQNEIRIITAGDNKRNVTLLDRERMPYTQAIIAETLRLSSIVPQGVQHRSTKDTQFGGYSIPNNTVIVSNLYKIHHDPLIWGDPEAFRPERFMSPDGNFKGHEALMPFSTGYRKCMGEVLARNALFLYATNVFGKYSVEYDNKSGTKDNGFEPQFSFIMYPKPYNVTFKETIL